MTSIREKSPVLRHARRYALALVVVLGVIALPMIVSAVAGQDQSTNQQPAPTPGQTAGTTPAQTNAQGETAGSGQPQPYEGKVPTSTRPLWQGAGLPIRSASSHVGKLTGNAVHGREHYRRFCIGCHGPWGNGEGENAPYIDPKPRDFTEGTFRCRSTPTGNLPTDEDLYDSIGRGFVTTNMPSWYPITNQDKADLVAYIKTFSAKWRTEKPAPPIAIPPETPLTVESIRNGHNLFEKLECWKCHGQEGRGDGPSANTLTNSKDQPIRPYDFADGDRFKCGSENKDIYRDFMTGLDGSPMPSFADQLKPNEAWDLVHFLRTLMVHTDSPERRLAEKNHLVFTNTSGGQ
jgi:mono/diheme cytochrome c family protein